MEFGKALEMMRNKGAHMHRASWNNTNAFILLACDPEGDRLMLGVISREQDSVALTVWQANDADLLGTDWEVFLRYKFDPKTHVEFAQDIEKELNRVTAELAQVRKEKMELLISLNDIQAILTPDTASAIGHTIEEFAAVPFSKDVYHAEIKRLIGENERLISELSIATAERDAAVTALDDARALEPAS